MTNEAESAEATAERMAAEVDARLSGESLAVAVTESGEPIPDLTEVTNLVTYQALATDEVGLRTAQAKMLAWADNQLALCRHELSEEQAALKVAKERRWATQRYRTNITTLERRIAFYEKAQSALADGYVIVPNFEMDVFAIRVDAKRRPPTRELLIQSYNSHTATPAMRERFRETADVLPAGAGKYVNPLPSIWYTTRKRDAEKEVQHLFQSAQGWSAIGFPAAIARPVLMERVAQAEQAKVFDEIGVAIDSNREASRGARKGDPILLGRIRNPRTNRSDLTFFLGWYFDPSNV